MRILLVEDHQELADLFKSAFLEQTYVVDIALDGQEGWELAQIVTYDLIILDVMLPKLDGIRLCHKLRSHDIQSPILMVTARGTSEDKVMGLDAGADDYLVKPVSLTELAARVRALLRRGQPAVAPTLEWGELRLNPGTCKVTYSDYPVHLTPKEYAILELLLRNNQRVYSRSVLLEQLWSFAEELPSEDTIKAHIKGLRQRLKKAGAGDLIETVYGLGYRLNQAYLNPQPPLAVVSQKQQQSRDRIAKIWDSCKSRILLKIDFLEQAANSLAQNPLDPNTRLSAQKEAHKLIGSLGTFGVGQGSDLARQLEEQFESEDISGFHLQKAIADLRQVIEKAVPKTPNHPTLRIDSICNKSLSSLQLLIVDDDQVLGALLVAEAIAVGLRATLAPHPDAAREVMKRIQPDVVLLDLSFADHREDGLTFLAELSQQSPALPVLVFTSSNQFTDRVAVARLRGRGFLQKTTTPVQVLEAVVKALQQTQKNEARILAVDDDTFILNSLSTLLKPWGLQVATLNDPLQFWEHLEAVRPDLLMLDVQMPNINGIELCQTLRHDPRWQSLPVMFLTSCTDADTIHQVFAVGADDYASKPIVAPELVNRIFNRLERTRLLQSQAEVDSLTGLTNRQRSTQDLETLLQLSKQSQPPLCLAVLELDDLKSVNQQYGYGTGDKLLRQFGQLLRQELRPEDIMSRWGGAEFVVGMYGMTRSDGVEWLAQILETLRQASWTTTEGSPLQMTFSAGVAQALKDGTELLVIREAAIAALNAAKNLGGDRVFPSGWKPPQPQPLPVVDVVLVHSDQAFAKLILKALETRGYHTHWLQDGSDAVRAIAGSNPLLRPKVILLGSDLPNLSGEKVLQQLKRKKITRSARVILLPTHCSEAEKAIEMGAFDYVLMPCSLVGLMQRLRQALEA
ncbi:response regulator [Phormidesmis sp. 146-33]